jgi:NAD(P)-dependent dehydrogenase (short-subunit alcohol dehydrogenase family)
MAPLKTVLVTGISRGIGLKTAALLAAKGYRVYGTSRDPEGCRKIPEVKILGLDVRSERSVSDCVQTILGETGGVDILVNNAGYLLLGALEECSEGEALEQFQTNFFGAVRMVNAVLPGMRERGYGRIINVSSGAADFAMPFEGFYSASKAALNIYTEGLRQELKHTGITASLVQPGFFVTGIRDNRKAVTKRISDYSKSKEHFERAYNDYFDNGQDPEKVARTILRIVRSRSPGFRYRVGSDSRMLEFRRFLPDRVVQLLVRFHFRIH